MTKHRLTREHLKEHLHYNPDTGVFVWKHKKTRARKKAAGSRMNTGYITIGIQYREYLAHRLAFLYIEGALPSGQVDHINHIRTDNRWRNLRHATNAINGKNQTMHKNNTSGITGVSWLNQRNKWRARIVTEKIENHLGVFVEKWDAISARKSAENKYDFHNNHGAIQ